MPCSFLPSIAKMKAEASDPVQSMPRLWTFAPAQGPQTAENIRSPTSLLVGDRAILVDSPP